MKKLILLLLALVLSPMTVQAQKPTLGSRGDGGLRTDDFPEPPAAATQKASAAPEQVSALLLAPLEDTFLLHSCPSSTKVIYLDFDGHDGVFGDYTPWDMDSNDTTFSNAELIRIQEVWQSVSEDFIPFAVDVTTEDPGVAGITKSNPNDQTYGQRAVIDGSGLYTYSWAYIGDFGTKTDREAYIYPGDNSFIWIADSISHEVGHTVGLDEHGSIEDGTYYEGHGSGNTYWAPIMGWTNMSVPYGLSQWDKGEYYHATHSEDSLNIITTQNGFGYRPDDHGSTIGTATAVDITQSFIAEGIIEQNTDVDYFSFTMGSAGNVRLVINGDMHPSDTDQLSSNLDVLAKIHDSGGGVLYTSNPADEIYASFDVNLPAGNYYLSIDGVGLDDPNGPPDDGYSDYGCLGYYSIEINDLAAPTPDPMTFATAPYATSESSIAMAATTATDNLNDVEYYFTCTAGGGNDSDWQTGTSYEDTGLVPETQYTYTVKARDTSSNQNETAASSALSATTDADSYPPAPDPMTWAQVPALSSGGAIASLIGDETNTTTPAFGTETEQLAALLNDPFAYDPDNPTSPMPQTTWDVAKFFHGTNTYLATIAYDFDYVYTEIFVDLYGRSGCSECLVRDDYFNVEFWLAGELQETVAGSIDGTFHDRVTASPETMADSIRIVETAASPNYFTLAEIRVVGTIGGDPSTTIVMTATTASDPSGVEYYFDETTGNPGGTDSGWQDSTFYVDMGLTPGTQYTYTVTARDKSTVQNETAASTAESATTNSEGLTDDFEGTLAKWSTDWDLVTDYYQSSSHSVQCSSEDNDLISIDVDTSGAGTNVRVQFKYRISGIDDNDNVSIYYWDGSAYDMINEIGDDAETTWLTYDHTTTDAQYRNSAFKIYIEGSSIDLDEFLWIDDVSITCE
jgi:hypothetical protein